MGEYIGNIITGYYKAYVSNTLSGTNYDCDKKKYWIIVDYILDKNGVPIDMGTTVVYYENKTECENIKVGSLMPKEYWQYHSCWENDN